MSPSLGRASEVVGSPSTAGRAYRVSGHLEGRVPRLPHPRLPSQKPPGAHGHHLEIFLRDLGQALFLSETQSLCPQVEEITLEALKDLAKIFPGPSGARAWEDQEGLQGPSQPVPYLLRERAAKPGPFPAFNQAARSSPQGPPGGLWRGCRPGLLSATPSNGSPEAWT